MKDILVAVIVYITVIVWNGVNVDSDKDSEKDNDHNKEIIIQLGPMKNKKDAKKTSKRCCRKGMGRMWNITVQPLAKELIHSRRSYDRSA